VRPDQVTAWLSDARFEAFLEACEREHERAASLYFWNASVSSAFMEVLHHLEVLLRNAIDRQFPWSKSDLTLSICDSSVWLCDPSLLSEESRERVNDALCRLEREGRTTTRGRVIAALSFGFWRALFGGRYENLWRSHLARAFPHGNGRRSEVNRLITPIMHFRNRVAHHEAVFSVDLRAEHDRVLALAEIIDREAKSQIAELSRVNEVLDERP